MNRITPKNIKKLKENEVFVFGTNTAGFHGAGAAGVAFRGTSKNDWRYDTFFINAMKSEVDSHDRIGKWAVYGISKGFMIGREGKSYGIVTIYKPGYKRSITLDEINNQIKVFMAFALSLPSYNFLVTEIGCNYAGYTVNEIAPLFRRCLDIENIYLPESFINTYND